MPTVLYSVRFTLQRERLFVVYIYAKIPVRQHAEYYFIIGKSLCKIPIQIHFVVRQI